VAVVVVVLVHVVYNVTLGANRLKFCLASLCLRAVRSMPSDRSVVLVRGIMNASFTFGAVVVRMQGNNTAEQAPAQHK
jgi:hypothetical protein